MYVAREPFPGFMRETGTFIKEAKAVLVDHDFIGIDKDNWRGVFAARVDWFRMHAVPVTRRRGPDFKSHPNAVACVEMCTGRNEPASFLRLCRNALASFHHWPENRRWRERLRCLLASHPRCLA